MKKASLPKSEWRPELMFHSLQELAEIYSGLVHRGIAVFSSRGGKMFLKKICGS